MQAVPAPAELAAAWNATLAAWDEPTAHDRVIAVAARCASLSWLARRYRDVQAGRPGDPLVRARLERIAALTLATLAGTDAGRRSGGVLRPLAVALIVGVVVLALGALSTARRSAAAPHRRPALTVDERPAPVHGALVPDSEERLVRIRQRHGF
jgi:hypothetical protein